MLSKEVVSISTGIQYASDKFNYLRCKISITDKKIQSSCKRQTELNMNFKEFIPLICEIFLQIKKEQRL